MTSWNKGIPMSEDAKEKRKQTDALRRSLLPAEKSCNKCGEIKSLDQFPKRKDSADGHHNSCKACENVRKSKYKWTREQWWAWEIKKQFGLTVDAYNSLLEEQNHSCAVCNTHLDDYKGIYGKGKKVERFSVDHCHTSGKVRGLLCYNCNLLLGHAKDNVEVLEAAVAYLKEKGQ